MTTQRSHLNLNLLNANNSSKNAAFVRTESLERILGDHAETYF